MAIREQLDIMGIQPVTQRREGVHDLKALILEANASDGGILIGGKALRRDKSPEHIGRARIEKIGAGVVQNYIIGSAPAGAATTEGANYIARSRSAAVGDNHD